MPTRSTEAVPDAEILRYEELLAAEQPGFDWPEVDERAAAAMCYTSGTTGNPKGVVYSHRSTLLHSFAACSAGGLGVNDQDRVLLIVPMFHANAWGLPYACWMAGADFLMPSRFLQAEPLSRFIDDERPTFSGAVPTIWADVLRHSEANPGARPLVAAHGRLRRLGRARRASWRRSRRSTACASSRPGG